MDWWILLSGVFVMLLVLFATGLPIFLSFLVLNIAALYLLSGNFNGVLLIINSMFDTGTSFSLAAIPLFILLGEILFRSGSVNILFNAVDALIGNIRARLYAVAIVLSTIFGALSGSAMAVAAMMGSSLLPEMRSRGYDRNLSIGALLAGASLAPIIPPSVMAVVLGILSKVSIAALLIAGILPGILLALAFFVYVVIRGRINPALAPVSARSGLPARERLALVTRALPFLLIIASILGFILAGIATPTEAAAVGCVTAAIICAIFGNLTWAKFVECVRSTAGITTVITIIMVSSVSFSQVLNMTGSTFKLVAAVTALDLHPAIMFILLQVLPFVLCMFIDQIALMIMLVPLYGPIVLAMGFDPIWFWTIFLINMSIGGITPPFGYTLFALHGVTEDVPLQSIFRSVLPFIGIFILVIGLLALFPDIILFLPSFL
ncbi:TRAP dicarboxylate transporter [Nitratireductor indicus C115]|uniref:TRAP transporter large permease protein n=1 Tax=Nitratireductor indicus C115 TaxID=1231190 RepID=K2N8J8_9HYPH|nr:TRAP transporter large permease [Nitratireductor indicus]EKF43813.1 TRAP dicarboxylate transporter [Nitratireductor indicus C115]SFQ16375.1 TRAP transporter, DctM subunit [Nitratireductor indicus]